MNVGVLREIKKHEYRVGLTPDAVSKYMAEGHVVFVETSAGLGTGFTDDDYVSVGALTHSSKASDISMNFL